MEKSSDKMVKVKIFRFDPSKDKKPRYETYEVPLVENMSVLSVLNYIYDKIGRSVAWLYYCRRVGATGRCGACDMFVNGRAGQACCVLAGEEMTLEPPLVLGFEIIKDLVASGILYSERDKYSIARANTFHRVNKAYTKVKTGKK